MIEIHSKTFNDDIEFNDDVHITGTINAMGNLTAYSIKSDEELTIAKNLESKQGSIIANSTLVIGHNLISAQDIVVNGDCKVNGDIIGKKIFLRGSIIKGTQLKGDLIKIRGKIRGKVSIQKDITATESIDIAINPKRSETNISGIIHAPNVIISFTGSFSKLLLLPDMILKKLGKKTQLKRDFYVKNLNIETEDLIIRTYYPPERINVDYTNSEIDARTIKIEQIQD